MPPYTSRIGLPNLSRSAALFSAPAGLGLTNLARLVLGYVSKMNFVSNLTTAASGRFFMIGCIIYGITQPVEISEIFGNKYGKNNRLLVA